MRSLGQCGASRTTTRQSVSAVLGRFRARSSMARPGDDALKPESPDRKFKREAGPSQANEYTTEWGKLYCSVVVAVQLVNFGSQSLVTMPANQFTVPTGGNG